MENTARSLERKLNETIDSETEKTLQADTELILACCDGLLRLDDVERYVLSAESYRENLNRIIGNSDVAQQKRRTVKALLIAAIIAALLAVAALGYAQVKYDIFQFSNHSSVYFGFNNNKKVQDVKVGYIPEGFTLTDEIRQKNSIMQEYTRDALYFSIIKGSVHDSINIDTEYDESKTITINGTEYIIYGEETIGRGILWIRNEYTYSLCGNLEEEEIIKIAAAIR